MQSIVECVPNFSEGRDHSRIDAIESAIVSADGVIVLHRTSDPDHNRSVITFAGPPDSVLEGAVRGTAAAAKLIDLRIHKGVHPRLGALDVLPFVPVRGITLEDCVGLAHRAGERIWQELSVPVYFYEAAARQPSRQRLENVRRGQFEEIGKAALLDESRQPDIGGPGLHPSAGAVIVGARRFLIAFNINLQTADIQVAKDIARAIRTSNGGLPAVKALGLSLASRNLVQVSINLTDFEQTGLHTVYREVARLAAEWGVAVAGSELIGLLPRGAIERAAAGFLQLENFDSQRVVENRIEWLTEGGK